jgi:hypothetical protein
LQGACGAFTAASSAASAAVSDLRPDFETQLAAEIEKATATASKATATLATAATVIEERAALREWLPRIGATGRPATRPQPVQRRRIHHRLPHRNLAMTGGWNTGGREKGRPDCRPPNSVCSAAAAAGTVYNPSSEGRRRSSAIGPADEGRGTLNEPAATQRGVEKRHPRKDRGTRCPPVRAMR